MFEPDLARVRAWASLLTTVSGPPSRSMVIPQDGQPATDGVRGVAGELVEKAGDVWGVEKQLLKLAQRLGAVVGMVIIDAIWHLSRPISERWPGLIDHHRWRASVA